MMEHRQPSKAEQVIGCGLIALYVFYILFPLSIFVAGAALGRFAFKALGNRLEEQNKGAEGLPLRDRIVKAMVEDWATFFLYLLVGFLLLVLVET